MSKQRSTDLWPVRNLPAVGDGYMRAVAVRRQREPSLAGPLPNCPATTGEQDARPIAAREWQAAKRECHWKTEAK